MMPLSFVNSGEVVEIIKIVGNENFVKRLMEMGFNTGSQVKMVKNSDGNLIVGLGEGRIVLGRAMAGKVMVSN
ncbi:FeoA family protein [Hathewaya limosa]|uniref:Ferrous iron transport protein A n=1 Tax=Hathewaya limosa TaxID=1536 RepID=A0ABU0JQK9_HATLI|nr:FeoA family protein [Hathewaya limosa]AWZ48063.1 ferrous iron transport protein A [Clostridiaceae bacterium 14S0207]MDQ0479375.1 ferrous iron transport protein A [Hathewaya limosa]